MGSSPTEPLCYTTTEFAFELDEVFSVFRAVLHGYFAAVGADQFFGVEVAACLGLVHGSHAILSPSEVGFFTLVALEVGIDGHGVLLWLAVVAGFFVSELGVTLLQLLELQPFQRHALDFLVEGFVVLTVSKQLTLCWHADPLLAERAEAEVEENTRSDPLDLESLLQTLHMEYMSTTAAHARPSRESLNIAHCTVLIPIDPHQFVVALGALLAEAGQTGLLPPEAIARMSAMVDLEAGMLG